MMTIRKFTSRDFTMDDLIDRKMLTAGQAAHWPMPSGVATIF